MTRAWWPLGCAAAFLLCASVGTADAQTFIVRNAPVGSAVEVSFGAAVGKGTADQAGDATVVLTGSPADTQEVAAAIYTDACDTTIRVVLAGRTRRSSAARRRLPAPGRPRLFRLPPRTRPSSSISRPACRSCAFDRDACRARWLHGRARSRPVTRRLADSWSSAAAASARCRTRVDQTCGNTSPCARESTKFNFHGWRRVLADSPGSGPKARSSSRWPFERSAQAKTTR